VITKKNAQVFLKAIHIQGFKSFADKIKLDLQPGMSVIIGPNGSGKSNIADAVRWVLGEQSAKSLRGTKMEDIIFAGSSVRRPVGMAEVSLIFDNSTGLFPLDYQEVVITRRVYRDGEGQFFINKTACRLKDIQELFLDTGSGKEGFSIIGQGRIEEILNLKSEERRLLIEEVSGISKFRHRKKEAQKRMNETEQNVERLDDIISEVEARIEPLAQQAEEARQSQSLNKELDSTEITLIVNELAETNSRLLKVEKNLEDLNNEFTVITTQSTEEENKSIRNKYELNQLEQRVQDFQGEVYLLENNVKEATHQLSLMSERQGFARDQLDRLQKEILTSEERLVESEQKITDLKGKKEHLQNILEQATKTLTERETHLRDLVSIAGGKQLEDLKTERFEILTNKSRLSNEIVELEHKKTSYLRQQSQLADEIKLKTEEKNSLLEFIQKQEKDIEEIDKKETEILQTVAKTKDQIEAKNKEFLVMEESYTNLLRKIDQASARLHALKALEENLDGYHKGVKETILASRQGQIKCQGMYGIVAENIEVEAKYELAVETALGSALQNVIVETTEDGKSCIDYLKRTKNGRATFLPLDAIQGSRYPIQEIKDNKGFEGLAVDLIQFDKKFTNVMQSLLGRILIATNMDAAIELAKKNNYRVRVVTLQGDQVNVGGSLTGGSIRGQNSGILGRTREIEDISLNVSDMRAQLEKKKQDGMIWKSELEELNKYQQRMNEEIKELSESKRIIALERKHREEGIKRLEEAIKVQNYELEEAEKQLKELGSLEEDKTKLVKEVEEEFVHLQAQQKELERVVEETATEVQKVTEQITASKVESARWEQELDQTRQLIAEENERLQLIEKSIGEKQTELASHQSLEKELIKDQEEAEKNIQESTKYLDEKRLTLVELRREKEDLSSSTIRKEEELQTRRRKAKEMEQQIHQNELRVARWQAEWENGSTRLEEEYDLPWDKAVSYITEDKKDLLQERISLLKQQIEELGPVNYTALEEYPEATKRFEFLSSQRHDLVEASKSLQQLINDLDKNMIERFQEGFKAVNEAFQEVFKNLFNGGNAELQLEDPENLLETGVRIIAQPPGKKAQLLSLLSGGERSFTAIALLFAFLNVKPSPFCLLDEIEAALDETNVRRFVKYLHKLSHSTQFILISHRRGTMESADWLFGITMEESGVSKLLAVELEEKIDDSASA